MAIENLGLIYQNLDTNESAWLDTTGSGRDYMFSDFR